MWTVTERLAADRRLVRAHAEPRVGGGAKALGAQLLRFITNDVIAHIPLSAGRHLWYKKVLGVRLGKGSIVLMHVTISFLGRPGGSEHGGISIGRHSVVGRNCWLDGRGGLRIGDNVSINRGVWLISGDHDLNHPDFPERFERIEVGDRAFFGSRAMVLKGVRIGEGAVVAAGAVVTRDVAPYTIVAGNPARPVATRSRDLRYVLRFRPELE